MKPLIVTGTDTDVGKTVVAAMLTLALDGLYWKPLQSGTEDGTDTMRVAAATALAPDRFLPEAYAFREPLSPHRAAEIDGVAIDAEVLHLPSGIAPGRTLIIEGAGGVLVPVTRELLQADMFARWKAPAILVARTALGTINHTLMSLEALRARNVPVLGIIFVGDAMADTEATIAAFGKTRRLGRLPWLSELSPGSLRRAFAAHFDARDFESSYAS
jgi:dethiobiotin synthetase